MLTKDRVRAKLLRQVKWYGEVKGFAPHLTSRTLLPGLTNFIASYPSLSRELFDLHGSVRPLGTRLGRGEVLVYFIFDDAELGGCSSKIDVLVNGEPHLEIKCAARSGKRYHSFFLGIDEVQPSLKLFYKLLKLYERNDKRGKLLLPANFANISKSKLTELQQVSPAAYARALNAYFDDLFETPIADRRYLFFDTATGLPVYHGKLSRKQLQLERVSGGLTRLSFKP